MEMCYPLRQALSHCQTIDLRTADSHYTTTKWTKMMLMFNLCTGFAQYITTALMCLHGCSTAHQIADYNAYKKRTQEGYERGYLLLILARRNTRVSRPSSVCSRRTVKSGNCS